MCDVCVRGGCNYFPSIFGDITRLHNEMDNDLVIYRLLCSACSNTDVTLARQSSLRVLEEMKCVHARMEI